MPMPNPTAVFLPHVHGAGRRGSANAGEYTGALSGPHDAGHGAGPVEASGAGGCGHAQADIEDLGLQR